MASFNRDLTPLENASFDVVIIGGGISGAWLALHCQQQGLSTALIEKSDYASQTSSSSSKLLHGGIRYLQQMQFGKVRESAMERAEYIFAAPHLSHPVPFIIPTYRDFQRSKFFLNCGMLAYQTLCFGEKSVIGSVEESPPPARSISAAELNDLCDLGDSDHTGAVVFFERHMLDSERMVLTILQTAQSLGAQTFNYVSAQEFLQSQNSINGIVAKDEISGRQLTIKSRLVINAAGPWIDNLNGGLDNAEHAPRINGFAVGSHIVTRQLSDHAIALTTKHQSDAKIDRGGRHVFVIPWRGHSLIGTSYDEIDSPNGEIRIQPGHVDQLLEAVNDGMPNANLGRDDLVSGYSGLYPLHTDNIKSTVYQGSGEYQIIDHAVANKVEGLVTALGAKYTTGRKLSELTMKVVNRKLGVSGQAERIKLRGADYRSFQSFRDSKLSKYGGRFSEATLQHLVRHYGSDVDAFIERIDSDKLLHEKICSGQQDILGQVVWAVEQEQTVSLFDMLFHRTSLGLLGINTDEVQKVAEVMAQQLGWSDTELKEQSDRVLEHMSHTRRALRGEQS